MLEESYPQYANFKRRVILPAIKELNETGYFEIDIKENKVGRRVDSIDFVVRDLDKRKYFTKDDKKDIVTVVEDRIVDNKAVEVEEYLVAKDIAIDYSELYIPDESVFTKGTLRSFKMDFSTVDFRNKYMERAFNDAIMITMDRDDVENIKATSYKFFKGCLENKVYEYGVEEQEEIKHKQELEIHW
jgi:plasmid replication initiation protein